MGSGDLSADLRLGVLPAASAVGAAEEERASHRDAQGKSRRRPRQEKKEESVDEVGSTSQADDQPPHQLDRLA